MTARFRVDGDSLANLLAALDATVEQLDDMRPAWRDLRLKWQQRADRQWRANRWKPLSPRYARAVGRTHATLDTRLGRRPPGLDHPPGQLRRLFRAPANFEADRHSLLMGVRYGEGRTPAFYAYFHQKGFKTMPARKVWAPLSRSERDEWNQVVADHVFSKLRGR